MKFVLAVVLFSSASVVAAQDAPPVAPSEVSASLGKGTWDLGAVASGGTALDFANSTRFASAGGRVGLILTQDRGVGWRRGDFEWAVEVLPLYTVFTPRGAVYGGSFRPLEWRWNFTSGKTVAPYVSIAGGILFSTHNLPPGNTSWVNFSPQAAIGANLFVKSGRAVLVEGAYVHHSNAGLGTKNPGYNTSLFFTLGYSWFRRATR